MVYCLRKHYCGTHVPSDGGKSRVVMTPSQEEESNPDSVVTLSSTCEEEENVDDYRINDLQEGVGLSRSETLGTDAPQQEPP